MDPVSASYSLQEPISPMWKNNSFGTYSLIWLDQAINFKKNIHIIRKLQASINYFKIFEQIDRCINHIRSVSSQHRIILVVNDDLSTKIIPEIHHLLQVFSIYIYTNTTQCHEVWYKQYRKIKSICCNLDDIIANLQSDQSRRIQERTDKSLSISIVDTKCCSEKSTTGIDGQFVQTQLLISCLLRMKTRSQDNDEFISVCRKQYEHSKTQLNLIDEFAQDYAPEFALWWYTRETFLYHLLNKALRVQNIDFLYLFGFFIRDLEAELRQRQYLLPVHVYRGQLMSIEEINFLRDSSDKLILMNSFLSTTLDLKMALHYLGSSNYDNKVQRVLFDIEADPRQDGMKPFADLSKISLFSEEQEILMMVGSIFCLKNIHQDDDGIWHINMVLCSENECHLQKVFYRMKNQYDSSNTSLTLFASVLIDMANFDDAEKYLRRLLEQIHPDHRDFYKCYHALGKVSFEKGNYDSSLQYLDLSLKCLQKQASNDSREAYIYNNIGEVYHNKGDINLALESYQKAFDIFKQSFTDDDENIAWCYNNLGIVYMEQKYYSEALTNFTKALEIKKKILPDSHPCLGNTYNNLGNVNYYLHNYEQALNNYQKCYNFFKNSLSSRHPSIARVLRNIGIIYEIQKDFIQASKYYEQTLSIRKKILSPSHPDLIEINNDIQRVSLQIQLS